MKCKWANNDEKQNDMGDEEETNTQWEISSYFFFFFPFHFFQKVSKGGGNTNITQCPFL